MSANSWHFRPRSPGEAIKGGVDNFAFQMSVDTLVRETIQNSNDQRLGSKVRVQFVIEDHLGPRADALLELLGWDDGLKDHLGAIAKGGSHLKGRAQLALNAAAARSIKTLTIRDLDARGLEGDEDGESGNFAMLCRHVLVTDAERKKLRGGAFGIGKSVLWAFSDASAVLFSSLPKDRAENGKIEKVGPARFFGRAYLVSHEIGNPKRWHNGDGHLGEIATSNGQEWAKSVRGDDAKQLVANTGLDRDWKSTGTSILIPFFHNSRVDEDPTQAQLAEQIREATQLWFWPSLASGILEVEVGYREKNIETLQKVDIPQWANLHMRAIQEGPKSEKIDTESGSAKAVVALRIPRKKEEPAHPARDNASVDLFLTRLSEEEVAAVPERILGSVAMVRGAQMVVEYFKSSIPALLPPFVGIVKAGEYRSNTDEDKEVEMFLRDAEPPAHDRWDKSAEKIGVNYAKGGHTYIANFLQAIGASARQALGTSTISSGRRPQHLADLLRGGTSGVKRPPRLERFKSEKELVRQADGTITASFTAQRNLGKGMWSTYVRVVFNDEQDSSYAIPHSPIDMSKVSNVDIQVAPELGEDGSIRGFHFTVPADVNEFSAEISANSGTSFVSMRSAADLSVTYVTVTGAK